MSAKKNAKSKGSGTKKAGDVGKFMRELDHPLKREFGGIHAHH